MKNLILLFCLFGLASNSLYAQITSSTATSQGSTTYTNGATNDTIFFWCSGTGELTATPPSGVPGWNFTWQIFNPATNVWDPYTVVNGVPTSTISSLAGGLYRVTIVDGTSAVVGCYRAWVSIVTSPTTVDVLPIPPGCGAVNLQGVINYGSATQLYNPPADPFIVSASTQITVCFTANHTYVSDLGFYLVGPTSCGSPTIALSPNPGSIGQGAICNGGDNVNNLCFSSTSNANLNVCTSPTPLTGTYGRYGAGAGTPINWAPIYGCDATQGGWRVQIYDCIGADVGALTNATITFTGTTICGQPSTKVYNSGAINSPINDNSCTAGTASIFTVTNPAATAIPYVGGYIWTANPTITIPNATTSLNPVVNPGPTVNTTFTLTLTGGSVPTCGGNNFDSELFIYTPPTTPTINPAGPFCTADAAVNLTSNQPGGTWSGTGITNPSTGTFDPAVAGVGTHTITYNMGSGCSAPGTTTITVTATSDPTITPAGPFCTTSGLQTLVAATSGGTWSGTGITNPSTGEFDPSLVSGSTVITYTIPGQCGGSDTETIIVNTANPAINPVNPLCQSAGAITLTANSTGTWSGTGITNTNTGVFDPAVAGPGTHVITLTVSNPCPGTATVSIVVNANPTANAGADMSYCVGGSAALGASGGTSYSWSPATGLSSTTSANPTANPTVTTTYTVTVTNANGCTSTDQVTVTVNPLPTVNAGNNTVICAGTSTTLNATGASTYVWTPASSLANATTANPTANPSATTTYYVTGTDANGCVAVDSVVVTVSSIVAAAIPDPTTGAAPLTVNFNNTTVGGVAYSWNYGNGVTENTTGTSTSTTYLTDSTYIVTLIAVNANGCTDTLTFTMLVYDPFALFIPNVFSPNGDGVNDQFRIVAAGITDVNMTITNRWGKEVGNFTGINGFWDGTHNGKMCEDGTYFYIFTCKKATGEDFKQTGTVNISKTK